MWSLSLSIVLIFASMNISWLLSHKKFALSLSLEFLLVDLSLRISQLSITLHRSGRFMLNSSKLNLARSNVSNASHLELRLSRRIRLKTSAWPSDLHGFVKLLAHLLLRTSQLRKSMNTNSRVLVKSHWQRTTLCSTVRLVILALTYSKSRTLETSNLHTQSGPISKMPLVKKNLLSSQSHPLNILWRSLLYLVVSTLLLLPSKIMRTDLSGGLLKLELTVQHPRITLTCVQLFAKLPLLRFHFQTLLTNQSHLKSFIKVMVFLVTNHFHLNQRLSAHTIWFSAHFKLVSSKAILVSWTKKLVSSGMNFHLLLMRAQSKILNFLSANWVEWLPTMWNLKTQHQMSFSLISETQTQLTLRSSPIKWFCHHTKLSRFKFSTHPPHLIRLNLVILCLAILKSESGSTMLKVKVLFQQLWNLNLYRLLLEIAPQVCWSLRIHSRNLLRFKFPLRLRIQRFLACFWNATSSAWDLLESFRSLTASALRLWPNQRLQLL